ncbi:MAG TPA: hypothetical protein PKO18_00225 [Chitinophagales bacterium]|nr:hypothetical protein [Chitinophagales bacterium]HNL83626.1 hypothetical protein [Chitinophagales bacterium]
MKIKILLLTLVFGFLIIQVRCTKEKIVEKIVYRDSIIYQDTFSHRMYLLEFVAIPQTSTKSRVILNLKDLDEAVNTSYDNKLLNVNTAAIHATNTLTVSKAVYDSVNYTDYYRSTTISRPSNDTLNVIFRIGTQGDVDIKTE